MGICSKRNLFLLTALILACTTVVIFGCGEDESGELDSTRIAEYNKPGTVLVETTWTADVYIPEVALNSEALYNFYLAALLDGTLPLDASDEEIAYATAYELANNPDIYLTATTEDRVTTMEVPVFGSGFIVRDDGIIVTNAHLVKKSEDELALAMAEANAAELLVDDLAAYEEMLGFDLDAEYEDLFYEAAANIYADYFSVSDSTSETRVYTVSVGDKSISDGLVAEVVEVGDPMNMAEETGKDVAVLRVNASNLPTVAVGEGSDLMDGEKVLALGYPGVATFDYSFDIDKEVAPSLTQGTISATKTMSGGWEVVQTDAYITDGSSGSPLFDMTGKAIAVNTFGVGEISEITGEYEEKAGYNFAVPVTVVKEFLDQANVTPATGTLTGTYHEAIDLFMDKHYSAAKEKFEEIRDANSEFPYVQDYIEKSSAKISAGEDISTFPIPTWLIIVIAAGVFVVIIIVVVLLVLKPGRKGTPPGAGQAATPPPAAPAAPTGTPPAETPTADTTPAAAPPAAPAAEAATTEMPAGAAAGEAPAGETGGAEDRFCKKCGNELGPGSEFCSKCGNPVE